MNKLDKQYTDLLQDILDNGHTKGDRTGTGTLSVFGRQIRHKMSDGFPLLTTKKMPFKTIVTELLWFLQGDTNIKYLVDNKCHIWDGDAYKRYYKTWEMDTYGVLEPLTIEQFAEKIKTNNKFAEEWGELGPIYGAQWRGRLKGYGFNETTGAPIGYGIDPKLDQIQNLINDLKTNPDSRRLMVNAWNVGELNQMTLPPCHYGFQVYTRELSLEERLSIADKFNPLIREDCLTKIHHPDETEEQMLQIRHEWLDSLGPNVVPQRRAISLMWNQRSVDTFLGLPFNIASYGLLLEIISKELNMVTDELIGNLGDVHLYSNHIEQAKEQIGRDYTLGERVRLAEEINGSLKDQKSIGMSYINDTLKIPKRTREPFPLPKLNINTEFWKTQSGECGVGPLDTNLQGFEISDFEVENYQAHPTIKAPLSN